MNNDRLATLLDLIFLHKRKRYFILLKAVNHPANSGSLHYIAKIEIQFLIFLFEFWAGIAKTFIIYKKISPEKKCLETLSFQDLFSGDIFLYLLNVFAIPAAPKFKQKHQKLYLNFSYCKTLKLVG